MINKVGRKGTTKGETRLQIVSDETKVISKKWHRRWTWKGWSEQMPNRRHVDKSNAKNITPNK